MKGKIGLLLVFVLGAALFSGCRKVEQTVAQRRADNAMVLGVIGSPANLNFLLARDEGPSEAEGVLFRGLTRWNDHWQEEPLWAVRVPNPQTDIIDMRNQHFGIIYQVRPDARWSDGQPLTSDDFIFTYEMALILPRDRAPEWSRAFSFKTQASDRLQVIYSPVSLEEEVRLLPLPGHLILPQIQRNSGLFLTFAYNQQPVGCGPFMGKTWGSDRIDLVPNPSYVLAKPALSRLQIRFFPDAAARLKALVAGELDAAPHMTSEEVKQSGPALQDMEVSPVPSGTVWCLEYSVTDSFLNRRGIREALTLALDRHKLAKESPLPESWLPPQTPAYLAVFADLKTDIDRARRELQDLGFKTGSDKVLRLGGKPFELSLAIVGSSDEAKEAADMIAEMWKALGVQVHASQVSRAELATLYSTGHGPAVVIAPHPMGPWVQPAALFSKRSIPSARNSFLGENHAGWVNANSEGLCREYQRKFDPQSRTLILQEQQKLVAQELPMLPLFYSMDWSVHRKTIDNWKPRGLGQITWNAEEWRWK